MTMNVRATLAFCLFTFLPLASTFADPPKPPTATDGAEPAAVAEAEKAATPRTEGTAVPRPVLRGPEVDFVASLAGSLLKSVLSKGIENILFPSQQLDLNRLLGNISADLRRQLISYALAGNESQIGGAQSTLADFELRLDRGAERGTILAEFSNSTAIGTLNTVINATGPSSPYVDPALPLYMAAVALKANAYEFRRKIEPGQEASNNAVIIRLLEEAIAHVRSNIDRRRTAVVNERLRQIVPCYTGSSDPHGIWPWFTRTYHTYYNDKANPAHKPRGSQADNDEGKALARCEGQRQPYVDMIRKAQSLEMDPYWRKMIDTVDTWAQTVDALKNNQPPWTARMIRLDFGGMFGVGEGGLFSNALINSPSCPAGYTAYEIKGTTDVDWPVYYCGRIGTTAEPAADFGGMFGRTNDADDSGTYWINNAITGGPNCPAGFNPARIRNLHELYYCWRPHAPGTKSPYSFGGMYSPNGTQINPMTGRKVCPTGYSPALAHGTRGGGGVAATREVVMCWMRTP